MDKHIQDHKGQRLKIHQAIHKITSLVINTALLFIESFPYHFAAQLQHQLGRPVAPKIGDEKKRGKTKEKKNHTK